ncbi:MAG: phosphohistidine phosphatase SixA [Candidatus Marinimicrobia bacterium]|nr:phosphohistidine phosphatase SixA [Candidatus Neomarinimicrobiota bacterium]
MKLYLVQHGESLPEDVDPERGLSDKGREDVTQMAELLSRGGVEISTIYHSGKKRSEDTARLLRGCLAAGGVLAQRDGIAPLDPVDRVATEAERWDKDVMLVGHLPFMGKLVSQLVAGDEDVPVVEFQPGSVICLERGESGNWIIVWMIRPELLRSLALISNLK